MNQADINHINRLIDGYFDATLSEAEERELRRLLADARLQSPEVDQVRAVMGFYAVESKRRPRRRRLWLPKVAAAAGAAAAVVVAVCLGAKADASQCVAYVGGTEITDSRQVMAMMHSDLAEIGRVSESVRTDAFSELSTVINIYE